MSILMRPCESASTLRAQGARNFAWPLETGGRKWCILSVTCGAWAWPSRNSAGLATAAPAKAMKRRRVVLIGVFLLPGGLSPVVFCGGVPRCHASVSDRSCEGNRAAAEALARSCRPHGSTLLELRPLPGETLGRAAARAFTGKERNFPVGAGAHVIEGGLGDARRSPPPSRLALRAGSAATGKLGAEPARLALDVALRRHRVGGDEELGRLQALELVAQPRRLLEVEVGGGGAHPLLEVRHHRLEVMAHSDVGLRQAGIDTDVVALVDRVEDVGDAALDRFRRDAVLGVVSHLLFAPSAGLGDGALHRAGDMVGVEDDAAVDVARGAADRLHERRLRAP